MAYCLDSFMITVAGGAQDADITIPGEFPLSINPGANYFIGFTYVPGVPAATGWRIAWEIFDADGNGPLQNESRPSVTFSPEVPDTDNPLMIKNGTIRGTVPEPSTTRLYVADVTILQA